MNPLVLGVDAGNSKTVAVVADRTGRVLGFGRAGNGDIYGALSEEAAAESVGAATDAALAMAFGRADHTHLGRASFCLAGLDWDSDTAFWAGEVERRYPGLSHSLHNDGFALLRAGAPSGIGVALTAGTGGAVVARSAEREWSASFWIREALGGYALGRDAFDAVVHAELGIAPATGLTARVLGHLGFPDVATMLEVATRRGGHPPAYATLARDVLDAAADDPVAQEIVRRQAEAFARYATAAAHRAGLTSDDAFALVLGGSVLSSERTALRTATIGALRAHWPALVPLVCTAPPVLGAVTEALVDLDGDVTPAVRERLAGQAFPPEFLTT